MIARSNRGIAGDHDGVGLGAVGKLDAQQGDVVDDVVVGDQVAARVDDDAGAHAVDAAGGGGQRIDVGGSRGEVPLAVDVDDGSLDAVDGGDDQRMASPRFGQQTDFLARPLHAGCGGRGSRLLLGRHGGDRPQQEWQRSQGQKQAAAQTHDVLNPGCHNNGAVAWCWSGRAGFERAHPGARGILLMFRPARVPACTLAVRFARLPTPAGMRSATGEPLRIMPGGRDRDRVSK